MKKMLRSMYSAVSGLKSQQIRMDVIANNIANVNTIGFKTGDAYFKDMVSQNLGSAGEGSPFNKEVGLGVAVGAIDTKFTQGAMQSTGRQTDFALEGDGMFIVAPSSMFPGGTPTDVDFNDPDQLEDLMYTRDGVFQWDTDGYLKTTDGNYVLSSAGEPITYNATLGNPTGAVPVENVLGVANFFNFSGLEKMGNNNYKQSTNSGVPIIGGGGEKVTDPVTGTVLKNGKVRSGFVEMSNVDLSTEFTGMIVTSRAFQANSRVTTTSDEMLQELVNLKR